MRVLVTCVPQAGHVNPLIPLVRAFVQQGDDVVVAAADDVADLFADIGVTFAPAGNAFGAWYERLSSRILGMPGDGLPISRILTYFLPRLFGEIGTDDMVTDVLRIAREVRPDVVLHDAAAFAGPLVAQLVGARSINHLFGAAPDPTVMELVRDAVSPLWRLHDVDSPVAAGIYRDTTLALFPRSMQQVDAPGTVHDIRPTSLPSTLEATRGGATSVYVTFGTMWANPDLLMTVIDALRADTPDLIVTTGSVDPTQLGELPAQATVAAFIPQAQVLSGCRAVVHHCGAGTMFAALAHGLPQVALPQAADNFVNAELLAASGAGVVLAPGEVTAEAVRAAARTVLTDPSYAGAAARIAAEIAAMPAPEQVAAALRADVAATTA